jgi:hypothetical protein
MTVRGQVDDPQRCEHVNGFNRAQQNRANRDAVAECRFKADTEKNQ